MQSGGGKGDAVKEEEILAIGSSEEWKQDRELSKAGTRIYIFWCDRLEPLSLGMSCPTPLNSALGEHCVRTHKIADAHIHP